MRADREGLITACLLTALLWGMHLAWLKRDTRPPVWDMALHQAYALNYLDAGQREGGGALRPWERSGNYPPFVHLAIAAVFFIFHPGPHVAVLANAPATFILFWALFHLGRDLAGTAAARWACVLTALTPYMMWISRETVLDYWLSAWFAAFLVALRKTRGFESRPWSLALGVLLALGLLTKWFFAGLVLAPLVYVCVKYRVWKEEGRLLRLADALILAAALAAPWYLPNLPGLVRFFGQNAEIGAMEGEPPVFSFQSFIYYLRLLEGYQLFGLLFLVLVLACFLVRRRGLLNDGGFLFWTVAAAWLMMTLLRTKDPRFTLPLLGPLAIVSGAWVQSWKRTRPGRAAQALLVAALGFQAYMVNFGISWMPQRAVIREGYQGSLRWDWNLYIQDYFGVFGKPGLEDWKQDVILRALAEDSERRKVFPCVAVVPDLPRFSDVNLNLFARLRGIPIRARHPQPAAELSDPFDGFNYVLMTEGDQGMPWTTRRSRAMNQRIVDRPDVFRLLGLYPLPNGDTLRLYFIDRGGLP
jgi:4-amino-4-deoxy-L-arabinose transferase-like glycosyltransferase